MKKIYVLDTNVLIQAPDAIFQFEDNDIIIPLPVLEELDKHKMDDSESGVHTRAAIRNLEKLRFTGDLIRGVKLPGGGVLRVENNCMDVPLPDDLYEYKSDNRILKICKGIDQANKKKQTILVTKDIMLRVKAQVIGIKAEDYTTEQAPDDQYTGRIDLYAPHHLMQSFAKDGIPISKVYLSDNSGKKSKPELTQNQFITIHSDQSVRTTRLGRVDGNMIRKLDYEKSHPYGITPRNKGQFFLQEALMQPADVAPLVIVKGSAGVAKTFYSLAVGLEKVYNSHDKEYRRILICRPNAEFDDEIGFLPGDEQDKIGPLMRPIIDNLEILIDSNENERYANEKQLDDKITEIFERDVIRAEAMNYLRGRSIVKTYLIIDEAQNMTPSQAKGIITRAGKDTKIIILGDPEQIDKPFLDERTNGLSYASEMMKGSPLCWQIALSSSESTRSELAKDAIRRL